MSTASFSKTRKTPTRTIILNINDVNLLWSGFFHAVKERSCDVHSVAFLTLGTAVQNKYFHSDLSPSASKFSADIFIINPCGSHVNPRSVEWIFRCIFFCSDSRAWGSIPQQAMRGVVTDIRGNELPCLLEKSTLLRGVFIFRLLNRLTFQVIRVII